MRGLKVQHVKALFALACGLGILAAWPMSLLPPSHTAHAFHLRLPVYVVLSALGALVVMGSRLRPPAWLLIALVVYGMAGLLQLPRASVQPEAVAAAACAALIPLAASALPSQHVRYLTRALALLWALEVLYAAISLRVGKPPVGTTGNINWLAILVLALAPWAMLTARPLPRVLRATSWVVICVASLATIGACQSRGALLALLACLGLWGIWRLPRTLRIAALILALVLAATGVAMVAPHLPAAERRPSLWQSASLVAQDQPLLGCGPGRYDVTVPRYSTQTDYHRSWEAAVITRHPHNELLYKAATLGFPAAIAWLALCLSVLGSLRTQDPVARAACCSTILLLVSGMLDRTLSLAPTDLLAYLCLGLCWRDQFAPAARARWPENLALVWWTSVTCAVVLMGLGSQRVWSEGLARLRGTILEKAGHGDKALAAYRQALTVVPGSHDLLYRAAVQAVRWQQNPADAIPLLQACAERAPDYADVQRYLGQCYWQLGALDLAAWHLQRQTALFPWRLRGWQDQLAFAYQREDLDAAKDAASRLAEVYAERASYRAGEREPTYLAWARAVENGDADSAIRALQQMIPLENRAQPERFASPTLAWLPEGSQVLPQQAFSGFQPIDLAYWQAILSRAYTRQGLSGTVDEQAAALFAQFSLSEELYEAPDQLANQQGSFQSCAIACIWTLSPEPPLIVVTDDAVGWLRNEDLLVFRPNQTVSREQRSALANHPAHLLVLPQSCFLRHFMWFTMQRAQQPSLFPTPNQAELLPGLRWLSLRQAPPVDREFGGLWLPPFEVLQTRTE